MFDSSILEKRRFWCNWGSGCYLDRWVPVLEPDFSKWGKAARTLLTGALMSLVLCVSAYANPEWKSVVVHISDSDHMTPYECNEWHRERGWEGCGYNFVVEPDGILYVARGYEKVGAHVRGFNARSLGFCFVTKDRASPEQLKTFRAWLNQTREMYDIRNNIWPHFRFTDKKRCPGAVWHQLRATGVVE